MPSFWLRGDIKIIITRNAVPGIAGLEIKQPVVAIEHPLMDTVKKVASTSAFYFKNPRILLASVESCIQTLQPIKYCAV